MFFLSLRWSWDLVHVSGSLLGIPVQNMEGIITSMWTLIIQTISGLPLGWKKEAHVWTSNTTRQQCLGQRTSALGGFKYSIIIQKRLETHMTLEMYYLGNVKTIIKKWTYNNYQHKAWQACIETHLKTKTLCS